MSKPQPAITTMRTSRCGELVIGVGFGFLWSFVTEHEMSTRGRDHSVQIVPFGVVHSFFQLRRECGL